MLDMDTKLRIDTTRAVPHNYCPDSSIHPDLLLAHT